MSEIVSEYFHEFSPTKFILKFIYQEPMWLCSEEKFKSKNLSANSFVFSFSGGFLRFKSIKGVSFYLSTIHTVQVLTR